MNLTVNNTVDTTFNKDITVSRLTTTGIVLGEGVDITLTGSSTNSSISAITANANGNTITLNSGATLNRLATVSGGAVTLKGSGTYNMGASTVANVAGLTNEAWTGTVVFNGTINNLSLTDKGNAGSTVTLNGWNGYFASENVTYAANVELVNGTDGYAVKITDGYSSNTGYTFTGSVSGDGVWQMARSRTDGSLTQNYVFSGNISGWEGEFKQDGTHTTNLTINGTSAVNATINNVNGTLNVTVDDEKLADTTAGVAINKAITASTLTLGNAGDTDGSRAAVAINDNVTVGTLTNHAATSVAVGKSLQAGDLTVESADGTIAAKLTGGSIQTEGGITLSNMALENAKLTGAAADTAVTLQDVSGAATLATGAYTVNAVAETATAADDEVYLNYTLGGITGLTLNSDATLTIDAGDVSTAVGDAESFTLVFTLGENGISLYDTTWTAEALAGVITFGGELGEWLAANADTEYTLADGIATLALDSALTPSVTYNINGNVLSSITVKGSIPEPTTATLSLLALAALAARRRRR